jgi:peptide/nickel transport system substrate-binding protein
MPHGNKDNRLANELVAEALKGRVSRRRFMEGATAMGLTIAAASTLWSERVHAATPQKGGHFRVGVHDGNTTDTFDTGKYQSVGDIQLAHAHRSYLTEITSENGLGPDMADAWSASDDATVWSPPRTAWGRTWPTPGAPATMRPSGLSS